MALKNLTLCSFCVTDPKRIRVNLHDNPSGKAMPLRLAIELDGEGELEIHFTGAVAHEIVTQLADVCDKISAAVTEENVRKMFKHYAKQAHEARARSANAPFTADDFVQNMEEDNAATPSANGDEPVEPTALNPGECIRRCDIHDNAWIGTGLHDPGCPDCTAGPRSQMIPDDKGRDSVRLNCPVCGAVDEYPRVPHRMLCTNGCGGYVHARQTVHVSTQQ